jgi:hypothetical protein
MINRKKEMRKGERDRQTNCWSSFLKGWLMFPITSSISTRPSVVINFVETKTKTKKRKTKFQFAGEAAKRQKLIEIVGQQKQKVHSFFDQHWIKTSFQIEHANRKLFVNTFTSA